MFKISKIVDTLKLAFAGVVLAASSAAQADVIVAELEDFTNGGGFFGQVTISDILGGIHVTVDIADPINAGLTEGDILGLWLDVSNESILPALSALFQSGDLFENVDPAGVIVQAAFSANSVNTVGSNNNNLNGSGGQVVNFDIGIALGAQGAGLGFNQTISFDMLYAGLSTGLFEDQRLGMRVQSISGGTFTDGSSKLVGTAPPPPPPPGTVPAPATLALLGIGLLGLAFAQRRRPAGPKVGGATA